MFLGLWIMVIGLLLFGDKDFVSSDEVKVGVKGFSEWPFKNLC